MALVWIAGPRKGKFPREGLSTAMPGHNVVYVLLGCLIALVGWLAWNMAGSLLWLNAAPIALVGTAVNTLLSAAAASTGQDSSEPLRQTATLTRSAWRRTGAAPAPLKHPPGRVGREKNPRWPLPAR